MASRATRAHLDPKRVGRRCESQKVCYADYADALTGADQLMEMGHVHPGCHITPYICDECGYYHVANKKIVFPKGRLSV